MNLSGFFNGFNTMGEALNNERIQRLRGGLLQGQFDDEAKARKERDQVQADVAAALAGDGANAQPGMAPAMPSQPPTMAAQGVMQQPPQPAPSVVGAPMGVIQGEGVMQGVGNSSGDPTATTAPAQPAPMAATPTQPQPQAAQPAQTPQSVTVTGRKPDRVADALKAARDSWVKVGNAEKAAEMESKLSAHYGTKLAEARSTFELGNTDQTNALATAELAKKTQQSLMDQLGIAAQAHFSGLPTVAAGALNSINESLAKTGRPMWNPAVKVASIRNVLDPKTGQSNVTPLDADGNPVTGQDGQVLHFTTDQWAKLGNQGAGTKLEKVKPGERVYAYDERGGSMKPLADGGPAQDGAEKAAFIRQQVNDAVENIGISLGLTKGKDGQMMGATTEGQEQRWSEYNAAAEDLIKRGMPPYKVAAMLNDHYERDKATGRKEKFSKSSLQAFINNGGAAPAPNQPSAVDKLRQRFGY